MVWRSFWNESEISIQDKYLLGKKGLKALQEYYLPCIGTGVKINIYSTLDDISESELIRILKSPDFKKYDLEIYICNRMKHDRYIELSRLRIQIGAGLDILGRGENIKESQECDINVIRITDDQKLSIPAGYKLAIE